MTRWYAVHTKAQAEERAVWHLEKHCFLPRIRIVRRHARKITPGLAFLFFELDVARWRAIKGARGVVRLLSNGPHPLPVPVSVVEALLTKCDQQCTVPLTAMGVFTRGLKMRIKSAFSGQVAEVHEIFAEGRDRIRVLLTLLGSGSGIATAF